MKTLTIDLVRVDNRGLLTVRMGGNESLRSISVYLFICPFIIEIARLEFTFYSPSTEVLVKLLYPNVM